MCMNGEIVFLYTGFAIINKNVYAYLNWCIIEFVSKRIHCVTKGFYKVNQETLIQTLQSETLNDAISVLICDTNVDGEKTRYINLLEKAGNLYGDGDYHIVSAPGRTEVGGNHTDHNHGCVVAASVNLDSVAVVKPTESKVVNFTSEGFDIQPIDLNDLSVHENEVNTTESLIRGIAARFAQLGYNIGGFDAVSNSKVLPGSGISSSASFEVLVCEIFNHLFNDGKIGAIEIAQISQYAENEYFGKPCGLMDQMAISVGGFTAIDFNDPSHPIVEKVDFDFKQAGYHLVITNTKGDHADLSGEYGAVPAEMKAVAKELGHEVLRDGSLEEVMKNVKKLRNSLANDRCLLRAIHFHKENQRAIDLKKALEDRDMEHVLTLIRQSGQSSYMYLQNVTVPGSVKTQNLALALVLSDVYLNGEGAFRVHGGGFEGTIQAFVPTHLLNGYIELMQSVFGQDATHLMAIRSVGGTQLI